MSPILGRWFGLLLAVLFCGVLLSYGVTQEVPIGKFEGRIFMQENKKPLPGALVTMTLLGVPDDDRPVSKGVETDENGNYSFRNLPAGEYEMEVSGEHHSISTRHISIEEGKTKFSKLMASPGSEYLDLYASQKVFTPDETPRIEMHGFIPQDKVGIYVYRLNMAEVAEKGSYEQAVSPLSSPDAGAKARLEKAGTRVQDLTHGLTDRDAEGAFIETLPVGKLDEGVYFVTCFAGDHRASTVLIVSKLALITKTGRDGTLCYTTDISTGQPVAGAEILARSANGLQPIATTGADGTVTVQLPAPKDSRSAVVARHGTSMAFVGFYDEKAEQASVWISGYCERPAYRPGDTINFKGYVRRVSGEGYRLPGQGTVAVEVRDPDGNPLQKMTLPVSAHGSFNGSFETSPEAKPGGYNLVCKAFGGESSGMYANLVAYRKPEFSIEVKPQKDFYVMGDRASAVVECKYYYGGPVVGAKVKASVYRSPAYSYRNDDDEEEQVESYGGGEYSEEVEAVTDASGRAVIDFDTRADNDPDVFTNDFVYTVSASVTEDEGKYFDGEGEVQVVRGNFDLDLQVQNPIVTPGQNVDLLVRTLDPTDSKKASPNHEVVIEAGREEWTHETSVFIPRERYTVTTGPDGTAHVSIPAKKSESLSFRATSRDERGREIVANSWAYVEGSPARADAEKGDLKVTLDKKRYAEGDSAKALIQTDMPGGTALVCVQTDRILSQTLVPLTSESTLVTLPVRKDYAPNVYISVAYVREKHFLQTERRLRVDREDRKLKVEVTSDQPVYKPGDTAQVTIKTTDEAGHPVPAEVSVGVVDEGIYDIAEDSTDIYASLYPERSNGIRTNYSFPEIYLDGGDKGSSNIPLRKNFKDTAAWVPAVWTGRTGEATVPITLPDNLTEWRVTAIGLSDASQTGMTTESFRAKKDLMVRLQLPQYLIDGDHQRMTVVVANDTGQDKDVNVELDASGVSLTGELKQTIRVPSGKPQTVEFDAVAGDPGTASVSAKAWIDGGGPTDGVQQSFPIHPHGRPVLETRAGEGPLDVTFPEGGTLDPKYGSLKVTLSPTLAGDLVKALDDLIDYPYGCVEQTMSRFMPSVLVEHTVTELGLPKPKRLDELPKIVRDSLARLSKMRHYDGGWGWWEWDESEPFMTALVLDGLDRARQVGYDVSVARPEAAADWGLKRLQDKTKKDSARDRLYLAYAVLRWGKSDAAKVLKGINLKDRTETVYGQKLSFPSSAELATAALAFKEAGMANEASAALSRLSKRAVLGEESVSWPPEEGAWGEEATAVALVAFMSVRPDDPLVPKIVRHLMAARKGDIWYSTRDTSYSLVGLTSYLAHTKELAGESTATVLVNGRSRGTIHMDPKVLDDPARIIEVPRSDFGKGPVKVEIQTQGGGKCYYTVALQGLDVAEQLPAASTDPKLEIERKYFKMEPRRLENGTMRLLPSVKPITSFENGDLVRVELTIRSDKPREFVLVEEPTPSSCRVTERTELGEYEQRSWWWSRTVILDDHLAFFARTMPKGESKITYNMRAEQAGQARALPTTIQNMYDPGRWSSTAENTVEVSR